jgi:beta-phosphoglucomutase family hydrolase
MMKESTNHDARTPSINADAFRAALFDMDGVLTKTALIHARSWKRLFDEFLKQYGREVSRSFAPFDMQFDYLRYVDGKVRYEGVQGFLQSRRITLPLGSPDDDPHQKTVYGLANMKDDYFRAFLNEQGVAVFDDGVQLLNDVRSAGLKTAVVSASRHAERILQQAGLTETIDVLIDGCESERLHLNGKPAPDTFFEATRRLSVLPEMTVVIEDALSGITAARSGGFGLIVGTDRVGQANALHNAGASFVVSNLSSVAIIPKWKTDVTMDT